MKNYEIFNLRYFPEIARTIKPLIREYYYKNYFFYFIYLWNSAYYNKIFSI